jgi:hypothetical protein
MRATIPHLLLLGLLFGIIPLTHGDTPKDNPPNREGNNQPLPPEWLPLPPNHLLHIPNQKNPPLLLLYYPLENISRPPVDGVAFPDNWRETLQKSPALAFLKKDLKLSRAEAKMVKALKTPLNIDLEDSTLEAVIDHLQRVSGVSIVVPKSVLEQKSITKRAPVSIRLKGVTMRTILKKVLSDFDLTFVVREDNIVIATEEQVQESLSTRVYPIADFLPMLGVDVNPKLTEGKFLEHLRDIIGVIVDLIDPTSWWLNGGRGEIAFDTEYMSLVITQTEDVHLRLLEGLALR